MKNHARFVGEDEMRSLVLVDRGFTETQPILRHRLLHSLIVVERLSQAIEHLHGRLPKPACLFEFI